MKNKTLCKILLFQVIAFFYSNVLYGQCTDACGCALIIPRGISYQHGQAFNGVNEEGFYDGAELILFYDNKSFKHVGYGLKMTIGKKGFDNSTETVFGGLAEVDIYMLKQYIHDDDNYLNPYIGFDGGMSSGFVEGNHNKAVLTGSVIVGLNMNMLSDYIQLNMNYKYQSILEDPITRMHIVSLGVRLNLFDLLKGFGP